MEFYKMNDKTDIYLSSLRASTKWDSWLYLQSEYAQRINISRREKIEEKFLVQTEKKETLAFRPESKSGCTFRQLNG